MNIDSNKKGNIRFTHFDFTKDQIPQYDLIKQKQGIIEQIYWEDSDPLQQLQKILDQQKRKVILSTPKLILF